MSRDREKEGDNFNGLNSSNDLCNCFSFSLLTSMTNVFRIYKINRKYLFSFLSLTHFFHLSHACGPLINSQNSDPLQRIQAEISEVEQREREHRRKFNATITMLNQAADSDYVDNAARSIGSDHRTMASTPESKDSSCDYISALSDDSGISSASSPINGQSANSDVDDKHSPTVRHDNNKPKYIRQSTVRNVITANSSPYKSTYAPGGGTPPAKLLTRTTSTPQIYVEGMQKSPRIQISAARKGLMQRFIAARGKIAVTGPMHSEPIMANGGGGGGIGVKHFGDDDELPGSPNERDVSFLVSSIDSTAFGEWISITNWMLQFFTCVQPPLLTEHESNLIAATHTHTINQLICFLFCGVLVNRITNRHRNS